MNAYDAAVLEALAEGLPPGDDLAFLAMTGKIEGVVRDAIAIHLNRKLDANFVAREHTGMRGTRGKGDLAVLDAEGSVVVAIEFKDTIAGDLLDEKPAKYLNMVLEDLKKSRRSFGNCPDARHLAVLTVVAWGSIPEKQHGLKYLGGPRGHVTWKKIELDQKSLDCDKRVKSKLHVVGSDYREGIARKTEVRVMWWLIDGEARQRRCRTERSEGAEGPEAERRAARRRAKRGP